ncbi:MAG TPA: hypothetical protein VFA11_10235 [Acidimicrobiales bacterium]|nr:hypothetical protein [Acidimicrobiales bacterium]
MKRFRIGAVVFAASLALAAQAGANVLSATNATLGAGAGTVTTCGSLTSAAIAWNTTAGNVTSVTVSGIPAGCVGGSLTVTLLAGSTAVATGGPITVPGPSVWIAGLSAQPAASSINGASLAVAGP